MSDKNENNENKKIKVLILGHANSGKSSVFSALTGKHTEIANYAGTTASLEETSFISNCVLIDTPGIYTIEKKTETEKEDDWLSEYLKEFETGDLVLNVCDSRSLKKDLFLSVQLMRKQIPFVLVINAVDELKNSNSQIDYIKLSEILNVKVFAVSTTTGEGIKELKSWLLSSILEENKNNFQDKEKPSLPPVSEPAKPRFSSSEIREEANVIFEKVFSVSANSKNNSHKTSELKEKIDFFLLHPVYGNLFAFFLVWFLLYQVMGIFVARDIVGLIEGEFFNKYYNPVIRGLVSYFLPLSPENLINIPEFWSSPVHGILASIGTLLAGKYGLLTMTVSYLFGVLLPIVWCFYFTLGLLEDTGYLARLSVLSDSSMKHLGLNGRGIIPLVLGFGCISMSIVTTKLLPTRKERLIMIFLLSLAVPCSAQLAIIQGLLAKQGGLFSWLIWLFITVCVLVFSGMLLNKFIKGPTQPLFVEIPPLRLPSLKKILNSSGQKSFIFLRETIFDFSIASLVISFLQISGSLQFIISAIEPLMSSLLHLPKELGISFMLGIIRRDFGVIGMLSVPMTQIQTLTACVTLTLFVPCIASVTLTVKELGWKTAGFIWLFSFSFALIVGALLCRFLEIFYI